MKVSVSYTCFMTVLTLHASSLFWLNVHILHGHVEMVRDKPTFLWWQKGKQSHITGKPGYTELDRKGFQHFEWKWWGEGEIVIDDNVLKVKWGQLPLSAYLLTKHGCFTYTWQQEGKMAPNVWSVWLLNLLSYTGNRIIFWNRYWSYAINILTPMTKHLAISCETEKDVHRAKIRQKCNSFKSHHYVLNMSSLSRLSCWLSQYFIKVSNYIQPVLSIFLSLGMAIREIYICSY